MSRAEDLYGKGDVDALFDGHPVRPVPFPRASRRKQFQDYDKSLVESALRTKNSESDLVDVDPRTVSATQPSVTRQGVQHYMEHPDYHKAGAETFADNGNAGNRVPFVYDREDGQRLLLSGHHRATSALLNGKTFKARQVKGPFGPHR